MLQGRGFIIPIDNLSSGTTNDVVIMSIATGATAPVAIGAIQGHFRNGDSAENVSFGLYRVSSGTPAGGSSVTVKKTNTLDGNTTVTVTDGVVTGLTLESEPMAVFGGNGAANWGWYPSTEEGQIIMRVSTYLALKVIVAPTTALTLQGTISITEL